MLAYNKEVDFETVSENELLQGLSQAEDDLRNWGVSFFEIFSIQENKYSMDLESDITEGSASGMTLQWKYISGYRPGCFVYILAEKL